MLFAVNNRTSRASRCNSSGSNSRLQNTFFTLHPIANSVRRTGTSLRSGTVSIHNGMSNSSSSFLIVSTDRNSKSHFAGLTRCASQSCGLTNQTPITPIPCSFAKAAALDSPVLSRIRKSRLNQCITASPCPPALPALIFSRAFLVFSRSLFNSSIGRSISFALYIAHRSLLISAG
jgi:hypothetical protein